MTIEKLLRKEIQEEIKFLEGVEKGTEVYKTTVDGIVKLADKVIILEKNDIEREEKEAKRAEAEAELNFKMKQAESEMDFKMKQAEETKAAADLERELKLKQMAEERKDRIVKNCISVGGIVLPIIVTIWGTYKSFEFEKEGSITTIMGRGFISKLIPKK